MTTIYDKEKGALNITLVECSPNKVSLIRDEKKDGYSAIQVEVKKTKKKEVKKEFRVTKEEASNFQKDQEISLEGFELDEKVCVSGITKGKGFQGVMKRHGFHGSPATHGHRHDHRAPGSIGSAYPQHVLKGKKMAGRMGGERVTTKNLKIVYINKEDNLIGFKGAIPGVNGRLVEIVTK